MRYAPPKKRLPIIEHIFAAIISLLNTSTLVMVYDRDSNDNSASDKSKSSAAAFLLNDSHFLPKVGLGVYLADPGDETYQSVRWALDVGYRLIDTAAMYENESDVGRAIVESLDTIPRDQLFITTKLDTDSHGYHDALEAAEACLDNLQTDYIDLLLMHSPYGEKIVETYDALLKLQEQGKVRSVGVSNFGILHLEALRKHGRPMPAVNQIEMHPLIYRKRESLVDYCKKHNIRITAYGSLFSGDTERFQDPMLKSLAKKYDKTVPQILLRWGIDNGFAVIPKSTSSKQRLEENLDLLDFQLTKEEVQDLSKMEGEPLEEYWDPVTKAEVDIGDLSFGESRAL